MRGFPAFCSRVGESPHFRFRASTWKTTQRARHFFQASLAHSRRSLERGERERGRPLSLGVSSRTRSMRRPTSTDLPIFHDPRPLIFSIRSTFQPPPFPPLHFPTTLSSPSATPSFRRFKIAASALVASLPRDPRRSRSRRLRSRLAVLGFGIKPFEKDKGRHSSGSSLVEPWLLDPEEGGGGARGRSLLR